MKRRKTSMGVIATAMAIGGLALVGIAACGDSNAPPAVCSTNQDWLNGSEGSPLMVPGGNCIKCHSQGEGPRYAVAGTVHGAVDDDTNCYGIKGVKVTLTGANGNTLVMTSNEAGNFYSRSKNGLTTPYKATVTYNGQTKQMITAQNDFNCMNCHTAQGANAAPGRIFVP